MSNLSHWPIGVRWWGSLFKVPQGRLAGGAVEGTRAVALEDDGAAVFFSYFCDRRLNAPLHVFNCGFAR